MKNENVLQALYSEYYSLYLVDGKIGKYTVLHTTGLYKQYNKEVNDFEASIYDYAHNYVYDRDVEKVIAKSKLPLVKEKLKQARDYVVTYQMRGTGEWRSFKFMRTPEFDSDEIFLFGVVIHNEALQQYYNANKFKDVLTSIADEFNALYRLDFYRDRVETLFFNFENVYCPDSQIPYSIHETAFRETYVHEHYRAEMKEKMSMVALREYFKNTSEPRKMYYQEVSGAWYKMIMAKDKDYSDERPYVILAVKECGEEVDTRNNSIVGKLILSKMFSFTAVVDLDNNSYKVIHSENNFYKDELTGRFDELLNISRRYVYEEDYEYFRSVFEEELPSLDSFAERTFRAEDTIGMMHFYSSIITRVILPEGERLLFFVKNEDEREITKIRYDSLTKEHNITKNMMYALGDSYYAMYYYNYEFGNIQMLRAPEEMKSMVNESQSYDDFFRQYVHKMVHPNDRELVMKNISKEAIRDIVKDGRISTYCEYMRLFGDGYRWVRLDIQITAYYDDEVEEIVFAIRDIHDEREKELRYNTALRKALSEAKSANEAKSSFLSNMSHDMRTPMNAILGMTDVALRHIDNKDRVHSSLNKIKMSGRHLLNLINEVLDMTYIESGKVVLRKAPVDLPELFHEIVIMIQNRIKSKNLRFKAEAINVNHETVLSDRVRLAQILTNILTNAVKYTPENGDIGLSIEQLSQNKGNMGIYRITISDTGVGMTDEFLKKIYEPFERAVDTTKSGIEGIGLGMSITLKLVKAFGGEIEVDSTVGKGTRFKIDIPMEYVADSKEGKSNINLEDYKIVYYESDRDDVIKKLREAQGDRRIILIHSYDISDCENEIREFEVYKTYLEPVFESELVELSGEYDNYADNKRRMYEGKKVLVVDDNQINLDIVCDYLEDIGVETDVAMNGRDAYEKVISDRNYSLVLMDVRMPVMDGYQTTRKIRAYGEEYTDNIPIIAMTANAFEEDVIMSKQAGMNDHMSKPVDADRFYTMIDEFLSGNVNK